MTAITRRGAMLGATAVVAVAAVPAAAQASDTVLLARVEQFHDLYEAAKRLWAKDSAHRRQIESMPDCPVVRPWFAGDPAPAPSKWRERKAFLESHGYFKHYDAANEIHGQTGAAANAIFETPARTARGVLEKVRILHTARGNYDDDGDGDTDLEAFQDAKNSPWVGHVIADLERLAGEVQS